MSHPLELSKEIKKNSFELTIWLAKHTERKAKWESCAICRQNLRASEQQNIKVPKYKKEINIYKRLEGRWLLRPATLCGFEMSDKQLLTGTTQEQKAEFGTKAPKKRTALLSRCWCGNTSGCPIQNLFLICAGCNTVLHLTLNPVPEKNAVFIKVTTFLYKTTKMYHILIKMTEKKGATWKQLSNPLLALHLSVIEQRERMKTK